MGILEHQGRGAISQNAVPESTIRVVIGSVNTIALLAIHPDKGYATTNFLETSWPFFWSESILLKFAW